MLADIIPHLEKLPQCNATQVKKEWADVVSEVRKLGSIAVTRHGQVEVVMMDALTYQKISIFAEGKRVRSEAGLAALSADFDRRLASFKTDGIRDGVYQLFHHLQPDQFSQEMAATAKYLILGEYELDFEIEYVSIESWREISKKVGLPEGH